MHLQMYVWRLLVTHIIDLCLPSEFNRLLIVRLSVSETCFPIVFKTDSNKDCVLDHKN